MTDQTPPNTAPQLRRPGAGRFTPKNDPPADSGVVVQRNVLHATRSADKSLTTRQRQVAGNLPTWEPLPPGEFLVRRGT